MPPTSTLRIILGDQLTHNIAALRDIDHAHDVVLMAEVRAECTYVRHHAKKLVLVLSAMRHFAAELEARGVRVRYVKIDDSDNTQSLTGEVRRAVAALRPRRVVATEAAEWRVLREMNGWECEILDDDRFLSRAQDFRHWAKDRKVLRMEFFYRDMRRRYDVLLEEGQPVGGKWNYDIENRKPLPARIKLPEIPAFAPDDVTRAVMAVVARVFPEHWGDVEGFDLPVTAAQAQVLLDDFIAVRLPKFGDWQDAMRTGAPTLFHSLISTSLNLGLLTPLEICRRAEAAYAKGDAPLHAVEGFIRQILGWREFIRGIYWLKMPEYGALNALQATRKLPWFYWSGETRMNCVRQVVEETRANAYAHHIQRLMITGNFALLAGLDPAEVDEWYMVVYADAYEWVEMPNTRGMALFADGGIVGSKPYAASGAYINRMSDYCRSCAYDVKDAVGERGCPFNALYWDFMARNAKRLAGNQRVAMPLRSLANMDPARVSALRERAAWLLEELDAGRVI
jgi:deoxyribodipyrimidine photolyase-related protein